MAIAAATTIATTTAPFASANPIDPTSASAFTTLQDPFTQETYATSSSFLGGIAFAPNGDVWADECAFSGSPLHRFSATSTTTQGGSVLHAETVVSSNAGCGLTNGPGGKLYSNTSNGVAMLDASTGAALSVGGQPGNVLGIAYNPATHELVYPDQMCRFTSAGCPIDTYDPASGRSATLLTLPPTVATFVDGIAFDPSGRFLLLSTRDPIFALTVVDTQTASIVQQVAIGSEPDGISVHWTSPQFFVATNNNDGTMTRFDFPGADLTATPKVSTFASGGFRGDLSLVGSDGCAYLTQDGTRFADGSTSYTNSIVLMCPGFTPSTGVVSSPAPILFVHGVGEASTDPVFKSLFAKVSSAAPGVSVTPFEFFQDKAARLTDGTCLATDPGQLIVPAPSDWAGMPFDASQNNQTWCDSTGDIGQSSIRLGNEIKRLYNSSLGKKVILVGYSMGGETIRAFLAHSTAAGDGIAATMVDSVVTMHGVQQGSWIASGAKYVQGSWAGPIDDLIAAHFPDPRRPATKQFDPQSTLEQWIHANSSNLPDVPYYNTWGDERIAALHCFFIWCSHGPDTSYGDVILEPGTDSPTQNTPGGGERFLPAGYTRQSWQWNEFYRALWDPQSDPYQIAALTELVNAPQQHSNITKQQDQIPVTDCQTGATVPVDEELAKVIAARALGTTYACDPSMPH